MRWRRKNKGRAALTGDGIGVEKIQYDAEHKSSILPLTGCLKLRGGSVLKKGETLRNGVKLRPPARTLSPYVEISPIPQHELRASKDDGRSFRPRASTSSQADHKGSSPTAQAPEPKETDSIGADNGANMQNTDQLPDAFGRVTAPSMNTHPDLPVLSPSIIDSLRRRRTRRNSCDTAYWNNIYIPIDHFLGGSAPTGTLSQDLPNHDASRRSRQADSLRDGEVTNGNSTQTNGNTVPSILLQAIATVIEWNTILNQTLGSRYFGRLFLEAVEQRLQDMVKDVGSEKTLTAADIGLMPRHLCPMAVSDWQVCLGQAIAMSSDSPASSSVMLVDSNGSHCHQGSTASRNGFSSNEKEGMDLGKSKDHANGSNGSNQHPNDSSTPNNYKNPDSDGTLPETESPPSSSSSPTTILQALKGTIALQARLIRDLHRIIDKARARMESLEDFTIPKFLQWADEALSANELLREDAELLQQRNENMKCTLDFVHKVLEGCLARERFMQKLVETLHQKRKRGMIDMTRDMFRRKLSRRGREIDQRALLSSYERRVLDNETDLKDFKNVRPYLRIARNGSQSEKSESFMSEPGGRLLKRTEMRALKAYSRRNVEILVEDLDNMASLIQGCTAQSVDGKQIVEEFKEQPQTIRDV